MIIGCKDCQHEWQGIGPDAHGCDWCGGDGELLAEDYIERRQRNRDADYELYVDLLDFVQKQRYDMRRAMKRRVGRWRGLRKNGKTIDDAEYAARVIKSYAHRVAACDRWLKENK